ncbi:MAG: redoxin domain-containing protein [Acidobacteriia bacterium]|nr:redoxin domain-containing protein [Terriglobia bacterium]
MLSIGEKAPDFKVKTHEGKELSLGQFAGSKVVLWFYPKADTPG